MGIITEFFSSIYILGWREGKSGDKVPSDPPGHALKITKEELSRIIKKGNSFHSLVQHVGTVFYHIFIFWLRIVRD